MKPTFMLKALGAAAMLAACGCATKMPPGTGAYVYVTSGGAITFRGDTFRDPSLLPKRLIKAGATPRNEIYIVPQGEVKEDMLRILALECGRGGLPNVAIVAERKPEAFVQKEGEGYKVNTATKPPHFSPPGARKRKRKQ